MGPFYLSIKFVDIVLYIVFFILTTFNKYVRMIYTLRGKLSTLSSLGLANDAIEVMEEKLRFNLDSKTNFCHQ